MKKVKAQVKPSFGRAGLHMLGGEGGALVGARDEEAFEQLSIDLKASEEIPITKEVWLGAAQLGYTLRRNAITVPLPDLLIAQVAIAEKLELWHADEHFEEIKRVVPFETKAFMK
jgi:predicted nucleic acid-binding protein